MKTWWRIKSFVSSVSIRWSLTTERFQIGVDLVPFYWAWGVDTNDLEGFHYAALLLGPLELFYTTY